MGNNNWPVGFFVGLGTGAYMKGRMQSSGAEDQELLRGYAQTGSQEAFAELVKAHVDMVYSASLRQVGHVDLAEDVTQAVFIILAKKAATLPEGTILAAWLHRAVRYTAVNALKTEVRRKRHER